MPYKIITSIKNTNNLDDMIIVEVGNQATFRNVSNFLNENYNKFSKSKTLENVLSRISWSDALIRNYCKNKRQFTFEDSTFMAKLFITVDEIEY